MITCLTHIYEIEASKRQIKLDSLELKVEGTLTSRLGNIEHPPTYKDIAYSVYIFSPETKEKIEELQNAVEATCPIYNMIKDSQSLMAKWSADLTPKKRKEQRAQQSEDRPRRKRPAKCGSLVLIEAR